MSKDAGKVALVAGVTGQDGAYLSEFLLNRGYTVFGTFRRTSSANFWRIASLGIHEHPRLKLVEHDLTDLGASIRLLESTQATEVYNLAEEGGELLKSPIANEIGGLGPATLETLLRTPGLQRRTSADLAQRRTQGEPGFRI
jgi:GDPmannose 4,6-dehydratase